MAEPATDLTLDSASLLAAEEHEVAIVGRSPWYLAWRRLRRNWVALVSLGVFILIVLACALAPVYAKHVAHTGPNTVHAGETVIVSGKPKAGHRRRLALRPEDQRRSSSRPPTYLGPTWWHAHGRFVLGTDNLGRDVAVRLLYGGRNSLKVGIGSALICTFVAVLLALLAGYNGGWIDWVVTRFFDLIWAFPVFLLAIALSTRAGDQRLPPLRHLDRARQPLDPDPRDLVRPDPLHRPPAARPDPVAAREGVRRGGDRRRAPARCA